MYKTLGKLEKQKVDINFLIFNLFKLSQGPPLSNKKMHTFFCHSFSRSYSHSLLHSLSLSCSFFFNLAQHNVSRLDPKFYDQPFYFQTLFNYDKLIMVLDFWKIKNKIIAAIFVHFSGELWSCLSLLFIISLFIMLAL